MLKDVLRAVQRQVFGRLTYAVRARMHAADLTALARLTGTDKWGSHYYTQRYQAHFAPLRTRRLNILEIGVGGHADPRRGAASLRMWKAYFPNSTIHGIDIHDKRSLEEPRIRIYQGSQFDEAFLRQTSAQAGPFDIVIDDGSHVNEHVIFTFETLFPLLNESGIYVVEDTQTSYWPKFGGDGGNLMNPRTTMNYFKRLADGLNYAEVPRSDYQPTLLERSIVGLHFYHNMIFVEKGRNDEGTNKPHMTVAGGL